MNFGQGHGHKTSPQAVGIATTTTPKTIGDQFVDVEMIPTESAATTMPPLKDAEPLEGTITPSPDVYNPAGNKYTQSHSPNTEDDDSEIKPNPSSQETVVSSQSQPEPQVEMVEDNPSTPDIHPGTPDVVIAQLEEEQWEVEKQSDQPESVATTKTADVKAEELMVNPLQVLLASVPAPLGSTTVTEEEDQLLSVGDITTIEIAVRPPLKETRNISDDCDPEEKDDVQLTSADVGDNMGDI